MIKIKQRKKITYSAIDSSLPRVVTIPLKQEAFDNCEFKLSIGTYVKEGQIIALDPDIVNNPLAAAIHSSVPGLIEAVEDLTLFDGRETKAVKIKMQGAFSFRGKKPDVFDWKSRMPSEIIEMISNFGVINTFFVNKVI